MTLPSLTAAPADDRLRIAVLVLAVIETLGGLSGLIVFTDLSEYENSLAQWLLFANIAVRPILALAALYFAVKDDLRRAIMALAAIEIAAFGLDYLPSYVVHGPEFLEGGIMGVHLFARTVLAPLLCVAALILAWRNSRLWLAAALVALPTVIDVASVLAFAISVAIYGF